MSGFGNRAISGLRWSLGTYGFIFHPHSDSAVDGWWFPAEETEEREVQLNPHYPKHSIRFIETAWVNEWNYPHNRPNSLYKNGVFTRDSDVWCGNQFFTKDKKNYRSWWHSPHGDGPLSFNLGTPPKQRLTPFLNGSYQLSYLSKVSPATYAILTPCVFKNGQLHWSYSDINITNYDNLVDVDDVMIVGGVYPVSDSRLIVVIVSNSARTATFYDIKILSSTLWTKSTLLTLTSTTISGSIRWPWRFNASGTECSTIVQVKQNITSGSPPVTRSYDYTYSLWKISISYNIETDSFSAAKTGDSNYYLEYSAITHSVADFSSSGSGGNRDATETSSTTVTRTVSVGHDQIPVAVSYDGDTQLVAWVDASGSTFSTYQSYSDVYSVRDVLTPPAPEEGDPYTRLQTKSQVITTEYDITDTIKRVLRFNGNTVTLLDMIFSNSNPSSVNSSSRRFVSDIWGPTPPGTAFSEFSESHDLVLPQTKSYILSNLGLRILYIDICKNILITCASSPREGYAMYEYPGATFTWSYSVSGYGTVNPPEGWDDPQQYDYTYTLKKHNYVRLKAGAIETTLTDTTSTLSQPAFSTMEIPEWIDYPSGPTYDTTAIVCSNFSSESFLNSIFLGFGAAADGSNNLVISYDIPARGSAPHDLPIIDRETVNYSNIPNFNSQVVNTITGDNVLLFPLGLA